MDDELPLAIIDIDGVVADAWPFAVRAFGARAAQCGQPGRPSADGGDPMASTSTTTVDHDEIRTWVEAHDGKPAIVRDTGDDRGGGVLRIDFPGGAGDDRLEQVDWDTWFETFD